ncbi:MAG: SDR family NAD(P)-dependent oxidoreductase [Burkholderiaceae bacterium]|jgi:NAD(P)-dependent dehydrogenase (short-subunit alcohol dehydrogenase family)
MNSLPIPFRALVLGSTGTIGGAFVEALEGMRSCDQVIRLSRSSTPTLVLEDESSIASAAMAVAPSGPFHLIVDATGALTIDGQGPEKRLAQVTSASLARAFQVNAIGRALVLKSFVPLLASKERAIFAVLSARVGSIADNHLGGWFGYRASKAAGNMLLQTAAIESHRTRPLAVFAALQPGTVVSKLSGPFASGHQTVTPKESVAGLLRALDGLEAGPRARFIDYKGESIPW